MKKDNNLFKAPAGAPSRSKRHIPSPVSKSPVVSLNGALNSLLILLLLVSTPSFALEQSYVDRLANAIYKAEGGAATRHPYGILQKYQHTSPRQACINTIKHKFRDWESEGSHGEFLVYLASKYAPINSDTDNGTNQYWLKNVRAFL